MSGIYERSYNYKKEAPFRLLAAMLAATSPRTMVTATLQNPLKPHYCTHWYSKKHCRTSKKYGRCVHPTEYKSITTQSSCGPNLPIAANGENGGRAVKVRGS